MNVRTANALTIEEVDVFAELIHVGIGKACSSINEIIAKRVTWDIPTIETGSPNTLMKQEPIKYRVSSLEFDGKFAGKVLLLFDQVSSLHLVSILNDIQLDECDEGLIKETINEFTNITVNSIIGSVSNQLETRLSFKTPIYEGKTPTVALGKKSSNTLLAASNFYIVDANVQGKFHLIFDVDSLDQIKKLISGVLPAA